MKSQDFKKIKLPEKPGVYFFHEGKNILYIGKATSLKDRVKSYFGKDPEGKNTSYGAGLIVTRGPLIVKMIEEATSIKWQEADSVLEAVILEANLIKKYQPKYNTKEKDNKSFNYVCITDEKIPRVLIKRGRNLNRDEYDSVYGPFPNGLQLREAMKIIRRIFPYIDEQSNKKNNSEFYKQLGLAPEIKEFSASLLDYKKNIKNLKLFFEGKKKSVLINLKKEMLAFAKKKEFERANIIKKRIFALNHINDVALIKEEYTLRNHFEKEFLATPARIEAYDIAHLGGKNMVGVMVVMQGGELSKSEYRKFIIKTQDKSNDTGALEEVLSRRFRHTEWGLPNVVVMDGSVAQVNVAKSVLSRYQFKIPVVSVIKDDKHKAKAIMGDEVIIKKYKKEILIANNESHRFAIAFHKKKRDKNFLK